MRLIVALSALLAASSAAAQEPAERLAQAVTIHRDRFGVAHAFGKTDEAALFGLVYARAEDELQRVELRVLRSLGRLSEVAGEPGVPWDRIVHAAQWPRLARAEYERAPPRIKKLYDAAAAALNYYLKKHPRVRPLRIKTYEPWHITSAERGFQLHFLGQAAAALNAPQKDRERDGSNMWAVGPARCDGAKSMLLINPHIRLEEVWEGHLRSDEGWNLYGGTAYGYLLPLLGFNEHLGWSLTVNYPDVSDVYLETFDRPDQPLAYRYGAGHRVAIQWKREILVKTSSGLKPRSITLTRTHHGPILGKVGRRLAAVRVAKLAEGGMFDQLVAMGKARDPAQFKRALERRALIFHNVAMASRTGSISYVYNGAIPRRAVDQDWSRPVDGADPRTEWQGYHRLDELPQVRDPASGYIQNCNSTFRTTTGQRLDGSYPTYMVGAEVDNYRAQNSRRLLGKPGRFSLETWSKAALDTYVLARVPWVSFLTQAQRTRTREALARPLAVLEAWDGHARRDSVATTLFFLWFERIYPTIYRGAKVEPQVALDTLGSVVADLKRRHGKWEVPWGELNRLQRPLPPGSGARHSDRRASLPVSGGHGGAGVMFNFMARRQGTKRRYGYHGNSFVCVVAFGPDGPRARSVVPYGVSRDPSSPHAFDQARTYARGELKPVWFELEDIRRNLERSYHPGG